MCTRVPPQGASTRSAYPGYNYITNLRGKTIIISSRPRRHRPPRRRENAAAAAFPLARISILFFFFALFFIVESAGREQRLAPPIHHAHDIHRRTYRYELKSIIIKKNKYIIQPPSPYFLRDFVYRHSSVIPLLLCCLPMLYTYTRFRRSRRRNPF